MLLFVAGRQPELTKAELHAITGQRPHAIMPDIFAIDGMDDSLSNSFFQIGSITKVMQKIDTIKASTLEELFQLPVILTAFRDIPPGVKVTLGVSSYGSLKKIGHRIALATKCALQHDGHSVRLVPDKNGMVSTATIIHNKLINKTNRLDLNFIPYHFNGTNEIIVAKTLYVQNIDDYTLRDRGKPCRDPINGMLPPKLAQIMLNLSLSATKPELRNNGMVLDPFCGSGTVGMEALLAGRSVVCSDINPIMARATYNNLTWLIDRYHLRAVNYSVSVADATKHTWELPIHTVASEFFLGDNYRLPPKAKDFSKNLHTCSTLAKDTLSNLSQQLPSGAGLCVAVPHWYLNGTEYDVSIPQPKDLGFKKITNSNIIYHRPGQIVGRRLLVLQKI